MIAYKTTPNSIETMTFVSSSIILYFVSWDILKPVIFISVVSDMTNFKGRNFFHLICYNMIAYLNHYDSMVTVTEKILDTNYY